MTKPIDTPGVAQTGPRESPWAATCPECHKAVLPGLPFCPACGKRLAPAASGPACPRCGTAAPMGTKFCAACGMTLGTPSKAAEPSEAAAPATQPPISLSVVDESGSVISRHPVGTGETTIGREGADLEFTEDPFLSPLHAKLTLVKGQLTVRDLGSRNGTWVFISEPHRLADGDRILIGSQVLLYRRLGYPGPHPPERDATRRMGSLVPSADIARVTQLRSDGSERDTIHLSPGRAVRLGRERGDWIFPYDPSMSGAHAEIRSEDADFVILDAGSRNGVAIAVRGDVVLQQGSRFLVGDQMLRVETA